MQLFFKIFTFHAMDAGNWFTGKSFRLIKQKQPKTSLR